MMVEDKHSDINNLPPQRLRVYLFIKSEIAAGRPFPSNRTIADHMGWKQTSSVADVLAALVKSKFLMRYWSGNKIRKHMLVIDDVKE